MSDQDNEWVERKVGEVFEFTKKQLRCENSVLPESCQGCIFEDTEICSNDKVRETLIGACSSSDRKDAKDVIFIWNGEDPLARFNISKRGLVHKLALDLVEAGKAEIARDINSKTIEDAEYAGAAYVKFAKGFYDELATADPVDPDDKK